jgi:hypothetical protein
MKLKTVMFRDWIQLDKNKSEKVYQLPHGASKADLDLDERTGVLTVTPTSPRPLPSFEVPAEMIRQRWPELDEKPAAASKTRATRLPTASPGGEA